MADTRQVGTEALAAFNAHDEEHMRALYADDPRMPELSFELADSYRRSGMALRKAEGEKGRGGEGERALEDRGSRIEDGGSSFGD